MKIGTMIRLNPGPGFYDGLKHRIVELAQRIEEAGFPTIWVGDSLGRGSPTLDPLMALSTIAAVTEKVQLGIGVLQLPLRHPIELAHRVQSMQKLSDNRLQLGVGSGSTKADFDLLGYDYDRRFGIMKRSLATMRQAWQGVAQNEGGVLSTWPGSEGGPPILMGAWRSPRWITYAAQECAGWTPSGRYSSPEDLEHGMRIFHEAGGSNAVLANVAVDMRGTPQTRELATLAKSALICDPAEAKKRLKWYKDTGFTEVLLISHDFSLEDTLRARDLVG